MPMFGYADLGFDDLRTCRSSDLTIFRCAEELSQISANHNAHKCPLVSSPHSQLIKELFVLPETACRTQLNKTNSADDCSDKCSVVPLFCRGVWRRCWGQTRTVFAFFVGSYRLKQDQNQESETQIDPIDIYSWHPQHWLPTDCRPSERKTRWASAGGTNGIACIHSNWRTEPLLVHVATQSDRVTSQRIGRSAHGLFAARPRRRTFSEIEKRADFLRD